MAIVHTFQDVLVTINFLGDSEFFSLSYAHDKAKNIFLYFFTKLKTDHLSYSIYKHNTIDIADPEVRRVNLIRDLTHHRVSVSQW